VAFVLHAVWAPAVFGALAWRYFKRPGAREPLHTAAAWTAAVMLLDFGVVALAVQRSLAMFTSFAGTWLPFLLIFAVVWAVGALESTMPWPKARGAS
jgi:hypothetical protein